jgi:hypothetical protein
MSRISTGSICASALLVFRIIHTIHRAMKHLAQYRFTGESRCPWQKWIPAFPTEQVRGLKAQGKARRGIC